METVLGMGIPLLILLIFELVYQSKGLVASRAIEMKNALVLSKQIEAFDEEEQRAAENQNVFGVRVIAISMAVVGAGISYLGLVAPNFSTIIVAVGALILISAIVIGAATVKNKVV